MFQELVCHTARPCAVEDVYNGTENSELDDEDRERIGRIKGFNEALDDPKHCVEKTWVGPKQTTRGGGNQDSFP